MIVLAACLALAGCASLALAQDRNWKVVMPAAVANRRRMAMRFTGWTLLAASLAVCIASQGAGFAALLWTLQVAVASFLVAITLSFRPAWLRPVARAYGAGNPR